MIVWRWVTIFIRDPVFRLEFDLMPVSANAGLNFGYPWWLSYGHLPIMVGAVSILLLGYSRMWSKWPMLLLGVLVV